MFSFRHSRRFSILSYGDRPNEYESVVQYFRAHFLQVHRRNNENKRVLYTHLTNVTVGVLVSGSAAFHLHVLDYQGYQSYTEHYR